MIFLYFTVFIHNLQIYHFFMIQLYSSMKIYQDLILNIQKKVLYKFLIVDLDNLNEITTKSEDLEQGFKTKKIS